MAKNKISEFSSTPANNTDIAGINIAEGCAPSDINNAIRELMAQLKDKQAGTDGDNFTVGGNLTVSSTLTANSSVGTSGQALFSRGAGLSPQWGTVFVSGMIMLWSGSIASIPSGWYLRYYALSTAICVVQYQQKPCRQETTNAQSHESSQLIQSKPSLSLHR